MPMKYIDTPGVMGAGKYHGDVATGYDDKRHKQNKHHEEQAIIENLLKPWAGKTGDVYLLDIPCGTGRFIQFCSKNMMHYYGVDRSRDMLAEAEKKAPRSMYIRLEHGNILDIPYNDNDFDVSLMIRMTRWLDPDERKKAMKELERVTREAIIFTARVDPRHRFAYRYDDIAMDTNWHIVHDEPIPSDEHYRIIMLKPEGEFHGTDEVAAQDPESQEEGGISGRWKDVEDADQENIQDPT